MHGKVIVDGYTYWITRFALRGGQIFIEASRNGPVRAITDAPAAVFGEDGQGICQSWKVTLTPHEAACDHITIGFRIQIEYLEVIP